MDEPGRMRDMRTTATHQPGAPDSMRLGLYFHIPFCASRCTYCDFNSYAGLVEWIPAYVDALGKEMAQVAAQLPEAAAVTTAYLGGGTPSLLPPASMAQIGESISRTFGQSGTIEFTMEANPGDINDDLLSAARSMGVNRISLGMQSSEDRILRLLGRRHSHRDTCLAVDQARAAGFDNLSLDLIYGLPGQSEEAWSAVVEEAIRLQPDHLSVYCLSLEPGTRLATWVEQGVVEAPEDDRSASMYEWLEERLDHAGFAHYEISNWARGETGLDGHPRHASRHNLTYWENRAYLGFGAGAHGYAADVRYADVQGVPDYVARLAARTLSPRFPLSSAASQWSAVDAHEAARDTMLLGLRLTLRGVDEDSFIARHGRRAWELLSPAVERLCGEGLLERVQGGRRIRLTARGRLLGNRVFAEFV